MAEKFNPAALTSMPPIPGKLLKADRDVHGGWKPV